MGTLLLSILLSLTATVGLSPLHTTAKLTLSPQFAAGTVCLIWESDNESGADCWTVEQAHQRTYLKELHLRTGEYSVRMTEVGQDEKGNAWKQASPTRHVEVY